jgi:hypothetical protein
MTNTPAANPSQTQRIKALEDRATLDENVTFDPTQADIAALPQPKPGTDALPKVQFEAGLLYITQAARPKNIGTAYVLVSNFLIQSQHWSLETIADFFDSRRDRVLPVFHSHLSDVEHAWKLYKAGLYNPFVTPYSHPTKVPDWGGFLLSELPHWHALFTRWYTSIMQIDALAKKKVNSSRTAENLEKVRAAKEAKRREKDKFKKIL